MKKVTQISDKLAPGAASKKNTLTLDLQQPVGFYRIPQIVGNKKAKPPIPAIIPVSRSTFLAWVKSGKAPAPIKLSERTTAWKISEIHDFAKRLGEVEYVPTLNVPKREAAK